MRCLCLSGGGALGAFQVGVIKRLVELGRVYDMYWGTSVGAIGAACLAMYDNLPDGHARLEQFWLNVKTSDVKKHHFPFSFAQSYWKAGLYSSEPLRKLIRSNLDVNLLKQSGKKLGVCAVNLTTKKSEVFTEQSDGIVEGVIASAITPMYLDPIEINGNLYIDGGIREVAPIQSAIDHGATSIDIVMTDPVEKSESPVDRKLTDVGLTIIGIMAHEIANNDITNTVENKNNSHISFSVIRPDKELGGDVLDFSTEAIVKHIATGYNIAKNTIG